MLVRRLIVAAVLAVLLISYPAAAHVPDHCSADEIVQAQEEKHEAAQELRRAVQRQDPTAVYQRFIRFIQADAELSKALDRWVECVNGRND